MSRGSFQLPVEVVKVSAIIFPGEGVESIKYASIVRGKDGDDRLEIEYITKFGGEGKFWFDANDFMKDLEAAIAEGKEPKYVFNHMVELVPAERDILYL